MITLAKLIQNRLEEYKDDKVGADILAICQEMNAAMVEQEKRITYALLANVELDRRVNKLEDDRKYVEPRG